MNRVLAGILLMAAPVLCVADIHWEEPWHVRSNGQRLRVETFSSRLPPDTVAQELARLHGNYQRYLVGAGRILLSGLKPGQHWLADIQGHPEGSQGYVSALYFDTARNHSPTLAGMGLNAATLQRLSHPDAGLPKQVFEFDSSAFVGVVVSPLVSQGAATSTANDITLIPSQASDGMALAVFLPEH